MATTLRTITVQELRDILEDQPSDALVIFSTDYGDYYHTPQALPLRGEIEEAKIEKSAYSNSGFALAEENDEDDDVPDSERGPNYIPETYLVIR